ncbi:hypothetical protein SteCoe_34501 [Stentor coeruleus]|uniref:USP domain-containing protein n=1 Tax=Stentor coeruleus TaxID=5963 RepID=A0A1R2AUF7_9CILI|nr:hypothetical protein SteCoe_34501 [Stentor coeruleus]
MNVQQISRFIEFKDSSWKIAKVISEDQESITFSHSGRDFTLKKSDPKIGKLRKNTERLEGADWVINNENYLYFDLIIEDLKRMISCQSLNTQDFEIISGFIYFAFYQMVRLNFNEYQNFIHSFEHVVYLLYDLLEKIFSDQTLWFAEKNDSDNFDGMNKIIIGWQELADISKILVLAEDLDNDYIYNDVDNFALNVLKKVKVEKAESFIRNTNRNVFSGKNCLRHIYYYSSWLLELNFYSHFKLDFAFMNQLKNLNAKKIQFYNPQITYDIIVLLRKISGSAIYNENEVLLLNLEFMRLSEKLFVKIDIVKFVVKMIENCILDWSGLYAFKDFVFLSVSHESLVKISGKIFEKLIQDKILDNETLKTLTNSIKESIIFEEYVDMISYFGYFLDREIKKLLFLKMIGNRTKFKNPLNRLGLAIIKDDINYLINLIKNIPDNNYPVAQIVAEILSSQGPKIHIYKFVTENTGIKTINNCNMEILRRIIQILPDTFLIELNIKQILSTVLDLSESYSEDQEILQETILILERYLKIKNIVLLEEVEHFIKLAKTGILGLEKICEVAIHGHLDNYIEQVFIELSSKAQNKNLPANFNKAFLYCFKVLNAYSIGRSENCFYFRNGEIKREYEFYNMLAWLDLGELEDDYIEIASQINVFYSNDVMNDLIFKNNFLKIAYENMKAELLIKLVKNILFVASSLGKEITLKCISCIDNQQINFEINVGEETTYSNFIYEISKNIKVNAIDIICYCEDILITSSTRIIDLKDKIIKVSIYNKSVKVLEVHKIKYSIEYFNAIIEKLITEGYENAVYNIIQEKVGILDIPNIGYYKNYYWMLCLQKNWKNYYEESKVQELYELILHNQKTFLFQMLLCILSNHKTGIQFIGQRIETISESLILLIETNDAKLLDGLYPNDLYYKIFQFMDTTQAVHFFKKLFECLILIAKTKYTSAISKNLYEMIYFNDDYIESIKRIMIDNVEKMIFSTHFTELSKFYSNITYDRNESSMLYQKIWNIIKFLEEQEYDKHKIELANGLELLMYIDQNNIEIECNISIFQKLFDNFTGAKILYRSELTRSNAMISIQNYLFEQTNLKNLEDFYDRFVMSFKNYPKSCVNLIKRISHEMRGIKNFGSTCYINSVLHLLFSIDNFKKSLIQKDIYNPELKCIQYMFEKLEYSILNPINTRAIVSNFLMFEESINPIQQMDATEFLNHLLDKLSKENLDFFFKIGIEFSIVCHYCKSQRSKIENSYILQLEVKGNKNLKECLRKYFEKELMIKENKYYCENCQGLQDAEKSVRLSFLPTNLFIAFTRFQYDPNKRKMVTINDDCLFQEKILLNEKLYILKGVVIHIGNEEGGHYIALINTKNTWLKFNDGKIEKIIFNINNIKQTVGYTQYKENVNINPYILLYQYEESEEIFFNHNIPERIINKNTLAQHSAMFLRSDFNITFMEKLIINNKVDFMSKILFTTFFSSDCTDENKIKILEKIRIKFNSENSYEFRSSFINILRTWKEKIIMILISNFLPDLKNHIKNLFICVLSSEEAVKNNILDDFIKLIILFKHSSYNFTLLLEILCELIPIIFSENVEDYINHIIMWIARDNNYDTAQNSTITRSKFSSPTNFSSFYGFLNNGNYVNYKTDIHNYFQYLCGTVKYLDEAENFARVIVSVYPFEKYDYNVLANAIYSSQSRVKIQIIISVFRNVDWRLDEDKQREIKEWMKFLFQNIEKDNFLTLLTIISSFTDSSVRTYLINSLKETVQAKIIEFQRAPGDTFKQSIEEMSSIVNLCDCQLSV